MAELSIAERVANGVEWLDENMPLWANIVHTESLDLQDGCNCVLGQLFGAYYEAPDEACWDHDTNAYVGDVRGFNGDDSGDYRSLTDEWRRVITERRAVSQ